MSAAFQHNTQFSREHKGILYPHLPHFPFYLQEGGSFSLHHCCEVREHRYLCIVYCVQAICSCLLQEYVAIPEVQQFGNSRPWGPTRHRWPGRNPLRSFKSKKLRVLLRCHLIFHPALQVTNHVIPVLIFWESHYADITPAAPPLRILCSVLEYLYSVR